jgi:hypothetical protein
MPNVTAGVGETPDAIREIPEFTLPALAAVYQ